MKNKIIPTVSMALAAIFALALMTAAGYAQKPEKAKQQTKTIDWKSAKGEPSRGKAADPNIKVGEMPNNPKAKIDAPPAKGGTSTRGGGCRVQFDNSTSWFIKVYVDGSYRGTMAPWDDSYVYVLPGETEVYARADFDDGSYRYWGPKQYDCGSNQYINFRMIP